MRPPATAPGAGLCTVAAVLLLTGCGGSDGHPAATASSSAPATSTSAAAPTSTSGRQVEDFCTDIESAFTRVGQAFGSVTDPAAVPAALDEGAAALAEVEPPGEIADDWTAIQDGLADLRAAVAGADVSTPEGAASLQGAISTFQDDTTAPQQAIEQYLAANCGDLDVSGTTGPAAPSS
jgi:hypothetical protein